MNRPALQQCLAKIMERIATGQRHIAQQREIVDELERNGRPADHAKYLLAGIELLQATHRDRRHRLLKELSKISH